jgi:hypothetical protein
LEQKTINHNKLQTFLCIIALTLGVLVSAVLFSMPPVHAEESNGWSLSSNAGVYKWEFIDIFEDDQTYFTKASMTLDASDQSYFYAFVRLPSDLYTSGFEWRAVRYKIGQDYDISKDQNSLVFTENPMLYEFSYRFGKESTDTQTDSVVRIGDGEGASLNFNNRKFHSLAVVPFLPCFESYDALRVYCVSGDKSGLVSVPELPNTTDEEYTFTGFSINSKTARWTGTTERSFAKEVDVEEYVKVSYAWATTTEPDNLGELQSYDGEFSTSDKQLTLPWSEMESGKTDFQFIRQVKIFPCYRVPHLAYYIGQPVTIYYNADGTIDKIEQTTIPTDSETIGNDISLIGFRYDNSFHAEWVDVWSNGVNKSAFDLSGSQYLSLGVKAVYYDGSKSDIDFYSLDRKNLTWNKPFSDFKVNNGSPIKSLYFTPYTKTGVNNPWNKGNSTVVNFDENGNASSSFDTGDDGTVHLDDFKLTGVVWNKPVVKNGTITWTGTTPNSDLLFVPDSDTLVTATYPRYDANLNTSYETWSTTTIGKGSMKVNVDYLIDYYKNSELAWNGEMWLTPCYKKGGVLYMGEPVIINCLKGTVSDIIVDKDSGKAEQVDKTDQNKSDADSILNVGNQFYSIINGLIGSLQQLPALLTAIFGFLPSSIINLLYASFAVIIICRILGR